RDNNHYDSLIGCIRSPDRVNTIRIKGKDCAAVNKACPPRDSRTLSVDPTN
ncbi:hypothetical protein KI387_032796, partial [Taxus chinensis]